MHTFYKIIFKNQMFYTTGKERDEWQLVWDCLNGSWWEAGQRKAAVCCHLAAGGRYCTDALKLGMETKPCVSIPDPACPCRCVWWYGTNSASSTSTLSCERCSTEGGYRVGEGFPGTLVDDGRSDNSREVSRSSFWLRRRSSSAAPHLSLSLSTLYLQFQPFLMQATC